MKPFMDKDFLLTTDTARHLYHDIAAPLPLVDYHCHISPREIYEDRRFDSLAQVWLGGRNPDGSCSGDHYKWRLMRSNGVPEELVTGPSPDGERIRAFAQALEMAIGNPIYHWCHLELRRFFGYDRPFTPESAREAAAFCDAKLRNDPDLTARGLIRKANVAFIGTTDDPADSLEWHARLRDDPAAPCLVAPSFRPDNAVNITKPGFSAYIARLAASVGRETLPGVEDLCAALLERLAFFKKMGCRASDHGLDYIPFRPCDPSVADAAYRKALAGEPLTIEEAEGYQTAVLLCLGRAYHRLGIVMQLHYSVARNVNTRMFRLLGADSGFDMMAQNSCASKVTGFLNALEETDQCPKTILYSLHPGDNALLDTLIACFQTGGVSGKIQHGAAWWFNDTRGGMEEQMRSLASLGLLGNFIGMLTDSRSFLSYARHEYFRRILCELIGQWVENGEYPDDEKALRKIVEGVSCKNALGYFELA